MKALIQTGSSLSACGHAQAGGRVSVPLKSDFLSMIGLLASLPKGFLKSLTFDNGKEFAKFEQIKQALGIEVYFAKPYHSWERGTNENRNGVVRKVLPKGRSFDDITEEEMRRIDYMLNDRPLRCLNWRTPREAFAGLILRHMSDAV
jgi:IS30 family transposase